MSVIPEKPQACQGCNTGVITTGYHAVKCSGVTTIHTEYIQGTILERMNVLDAMFDIPDIWRRSSVWSDIKNGLCAMWSKCLGRMWHSGYDGSPGDEQIRDDS